MCDQKRHTVNDIADNQVLKTYRRIIDAFKAKQFQTAPDECPAFLAHRSHDTTVLFLCGSAAQALGLTKTYVELFEGAAALNPA